jgi:hypothetical protein
MGKKCTLIQVQYNYSHFSTKEMHVDPGAVLHMKSKLLILYKSEYILFISFMFITINALIPLFYFKNRFSVILLCYYEVSLYCSCTDIPYLH